jgi:hypothetical protein
MFFKKEPKTIKTSIGLISKQTIKENPKLIEDAFVKLIDEETNEDDLLYERIINKINEICKERYGTFAGRYHYIDYNETEKSIKVFKEIKKSLFKKTEFLDRIDRTKKLKEEHNHLIDKYGKKNKEDD